MTLDDLCAKCGIDRWNMATWMAGAYLASPYLYIRPDPNARAFIERHYLPLFREVIPAIKLRTIQAKPTPDAKPTKYPSVKPGPWRDQLDLLDN